MRSQIGMQDEISHLKQCLHKQHTLCLNLVKALHPVQGTRNYGLQHLPPQMKIHDTWRKPYDKTPHVGHIHGEKTFCFKGKKTSCMEYCNVCR